MIKKHIYLTASAAAAIAVFLMAWLNIWPSLNLRLQDAVYQRENPVDTNIKIIAIDEKTLDALGQFEQWTRKPYAQLIEVLNQKEDCAPAVIGFDILMVSDKGPEDRLLESACERYSNIVMASHLVFGEKIVRKDGHSYSGSAVVELEEKPFGRLDTLAASGFVNTVLDPADNAVRYALLEAGGYRSFDMAVVDLAAGRKTETGRHSGVHIDYTSGPGSYETLSMIDVLEERIPPEAFSDSIVLVGICAAGMGDIYTVPAGRGAGMYGVEVHANIIQGIMEQRFLYPVNAFLMAAVYSMVMFLEALVCSRRKIRFNVALSAGTILLVYGAAVLLDNYGFVIDLLALPLGLGTFLIWNTASRYAVEVYHKRQILHAFKKYVAPQVVDEIAKNDQFQLRLGGEKRDIAVLFVDIRGFTPLSEKLQPEQVVEILNEYLKMVTKAVFAHNGTLDKFIGDAAMAVFNAPFDSDDYVYRAVCTAADIAAGSSGLSEHLMKRFGVPLNYGIGVNCGPAVVGNIGSDFRMDYTAIGDTVNTAARLESRAAAGQILISDEVRIRLKDRIEVSFLGKMALKGKAREVDVYALDRVKGS